MKTHSTWHALVVVSATLLVCSSAEAQTCPEASSTKYEGSLNANDSRTYTIHLQPCETVVVDMTGSAPANGAAMSLKLRNASGQNLTVINFGCYGSCAQTVPKTDSSAGFPLPGTRGVEGLAEDFVISTGSVIGTPPTMTYTLTVHRVPRPGYNIGGTAFGNAPLVQANAALYGSLHTWEPGQFYKISIGAGQLIYIAGQARGPAIGAMFRIELYNSSLQLVKTLIADAVRETPVIFPTAPNYDFYRNTGAAADFYLKFATQFWSVLDFQIEPRIPAQSQLTLFLDADNDFESNPVNDVAAYVPGSVLATGESLPPGSEGTFLQQVRAIAAFVDEFGQIVPQPVGITSATFALENTSAFAGRAMNWGSSATPDFALVSGTSASFSGKLAKKTINAYDYGGFTTVKVTVTGFPSETMRVPRDDSPANLIPDAGWRGYSTGNQIADTNDPSSADADTTANNTYVGDGFSRFEEFRGFVVQGQHIRLSPDVKDLFVFSALVEGLGYAINLPIRVHSILQDEMGAFRDINFRYTNSGSGGPMPGHSAEPDTGYHQEAVHVIDGGLSPDGFMGAVFWPGGAFHVPINTIGPAYVYGETIRLLTPTINNSTDVDDVDPEVRRHTIGHEIGHTIHMSHQPAAPDTANPPLALCPAIPFTIMTSAYFIQSNGTIPLRDCPWQNIPTLYDDVDKAALTLR